MTIENLRLYLFFLSHFRNGFALIENYRRGGILAGGPILAEVKLWDGTRLIHPPDRSGMVGVLAETWYHNVYRIGKFYAPNPGDLVVDAGAHVGLFSLWLNRRYPDVRIVALEPSPENYPCLISNVASAAAQCVKTYQLAVAGADCEVSFLPIATNRTSDLRTCASVGGETEATPALGLTSVLQLVGGERIALLKMDVEGAEYDFFARASECDLMKVDRIAMEYHNNWRPGTLDVVKQALQHTHALELPNGSGDVGLLFATRKSLSRGQR